jgi:hypothetical protein
VRYRILLDSVTGLVLLGVPHIRGTGEATTQRVATLLRPTLKSVSKKSLRREDLSRLDLLSDRFREVRLSLPEGLISAYETINTPLASATWTIWKSFAVLVDKRFATIEWPDNQEQLLALDIELDAVLQPNRPSKFLSQLAEYMTKVAKAAFVDMC